METPKEALIKVLVHWFCGPDEIPHHDSLADLATDILNDLKEEGGWELVKIIPRSTPFMGIYPQRGKDAS